MLRRGRTLVVCCLLGLVVLAGVMLQGPARFTGIRWVPEFTLPQGTPPPDLLRPSNASQPPLPPGARRVGTLDLSPVLWVALAAALAVAVLLFMRWLRRRPPREAPALLDAALSEPVSEPVEEPAEPEPDAPRMRRGFAHALAILDEERVPGDAIVQAWLGLQEAAEESGIQRRGAETPTEFTLRIIGRVPTDRAAITILLNSYLRVRFGDHPATERDVEAAREAFRSLAASWQARDEARAAPVRNRITP
jgi:hypothetical protein